MSQGQPTDRVPKEEIKCFTQLVFSPYRSKGDTIKSQTTYCATVSCITAKTLERGFFNDD